MPESLTAVPWTAVTIGLVALVVLLEVAALWIMAARLRVLPRLDDRMMRLADTVTLLTETTEGCFRVIGAQLTTASATTAAAGRGRQRRVVGATRRGQSLAQIAAQESVSESEVALRQHLSDRPSEA